MVLVPPTPFIHASVSFTIFLIILYFIYALMRSYVHRISLELCAAAAATVATTTKTMYARYDMAMCHGVDMPTENPFHAKQMTGDLLTQN